MHILIAEDQPISRRLLRATLEAEGHRITEAADGAEALAAFRRELPDAIVSDILMPNLDGYRLCREVRRTPEGAAVPFLFYTATYTSVADEQLAADVGGDGFLEKPAPAGDILDALDRARRHPRAPRAAPTDDSDVLREYSERLVAKLETKNLELAATNAALAQSEARLNEAQRNARIGSWRFVPGQPLQWSDEMFELFQFPRHMAPTTDALIAAVHPDDRATLFEPAFRAALAPGAATTEVEYRIVLPGGAVRTMFSLGQIRRAPDGAVQEIFGTLQDVTERKAAEEALRHSEEGLRLALAAARMGTFDWEIPSGQITWSRGHEVLWGLAEGGFDGTYAGFAHRVHPDDLPGIEAEVARCRAERTPYAREFRVVWPDGSLHWIAGRGEFEFDAAGQAVRMRGAVVEITARKQAEEQLRAFAARLQAAREQERTHLAREIHDVLAQELTRLKIDLVWLARRAARPVDEPARAAIVARIQDATAQADVAISTVQRIATELRPVILDSLGLPAAIEWLAEDFARRTGLACHKEVPPGDTTLDRDRATAVFRIVQECLTNVARHARASRVDIRLVEDAGGVALTVADDGVGIEPARLADPHAIGLLGMRERAEAFGGAFAIASRPGSTRVALRLPRHSP